MMIRQIKPSDNPVLAQIIRASLEEAKLALPGTAYFDASLDNLSEFYFLNAKNVIKKLYPEIYIPTLIKIIKKGCSKKSFSYYMDGLLLSLYIDDRIQYEMLLKEENVKKYVDQYKSNELFLLISGNEENIAKKGFVRYE